MFPPQLMPLFLGIAVEVHQAAAVCCHKLIRSGLGQRLEFVCRHGCRNFRMPDREGAAEPTAFLSPCWLNHGYSVELRQKLRPGAPQAELAPG